MNEPTKIAAPVSRRRFATVEEALERMDPSYPVCCLFPGVIEGLAREFIQHFPGTPLYAVKCNPHPMVLKALHRGGICSFDTASLAEIALINELFDDAHCYFNHPVKSRAAIDAAVRVYDMKDFVVDHMSELNKVTKIAGTDVTVEVRVRTRKSTSAFNLSAKFGAEPEEAVELLREANARGCRTAVAFHVGSQCSEPEAYRDAIALARRVVDAAEVELSYLNCGGGFPAPYDYEVPPLEAFTDVIRAAVELYGFTCPLIAEPGRALVAQGGAMLAQVHMRRGNDLYLNDGIYGCMSEIRDGDFYPPALAIGRKRTLEGEGELFRIFGPTCDSTDQLKAPYLFPGDIDEGDWIEFGNMGAYSIAVQSHFNGFVTDTIVEVEEKTPRF